MGFSLTLINLGGMVALLLWGIHMVQTGMQRAFGAKLRRVLSLALQNRFKAFLAGLGVTALLQSSTATGLMVAGFAAGGLVDLVPGLAVMLGANVGTTLIVQVLSFNVSEIAPLLILVGVVLFRKGVAAPHDFGRVLIGLGLVLIALHQFVDLVTPYESTPGVKLLLSKISAEPLVDLLLAAALTWAAHSSVAVVLVVMSFAAKGVVTSVTAFAFVLGANLGTAINPVIEGAGQKDSAPRWVPIGNLINRLASVILVMAVLPYVTPIWETWVPDRGQAVATFHVAFNVVTATLFFPFLKPYARFLKRWIPARREKYDPGQALYLDAAVRDDPPLAIGAAAREALRMADFLEDMLKGVREAFEKADRRQIGDTRVLDDVLDKLNTAIKAYLVSLESERLTGDDHRRIKQILTFATNIEQAGDVIDRNLLNIAEKLARRGLAFSESGQAELLSIVDRLLGNVRSCAAVFMTGDERAARALAAEKEAFRALETSATEAHFERLRLGRIDTAETSASHLDALSDLKSINNHLVAAAAYPLLASSGLLMPTRLRLERSRDQ